MKDFWKILTNNAWNNFNACEKEWWIHMQAFRASAAVYEHNSAHFLTQISNPVNNSITGLHVEFYRDGKSGTNFISFEGTDFTDIRHLGADLILLLTGQPTQATINLVNQIKQWVKENDGLVILTGHSLGASVASFVSLLTGIPAIVFENPGIGSNSALKNVISYQSRANSINSMDDFANLHPFLKIIAGIRMLFKGPLQQGEVVKLPYPGTLSRLFSSIPIVGGVFSHLIAYIKDAFKKMQNDRQDRALYPCGPHFYEDYEQSKHSSYQQNFVPSAASAEIDPSFSQFNDVCKNDNLPVNQINTENAHPAVIDEPNSLTAEVANQYLNANVPIVTPSLKRENERHPPDQVRIWYRKISYMETIAMCWLPLFKGQIAPVFYNSANIFYATRNIRDIGFRWYQSRQLNLNYQSLLLGSIPMLCGFLPQHMRNYTENTLQGFSVANDLYSLCYATPRIIHNVQSSNFIMAGYDLNMGLSSLVFWGGQKYFNSLRACGNAPEEFMGIMTEKYVNNPMLHSFVFTPLLFDPTGLSFVLAVTTIVILSYQAQQSKSENIVHNKFFNADPKEYSYLLSEIKDATKPDLTSENILDLQDRFTFFSNTYHYLEEKNKNLSQLGASFSSFDQKIQYLESKWINKNIQHELKQMRASIKEAKSLQRLHQLRRNLQQMSFEFSEVSKMTEEFKWLLVSLHAERKNNENLNRQTNNQQPPQKFIEYLKNQTNIIDQCSNETSNRLAKLNGLMNRHSEGLDKLTTEELRSDFVNQSVISDCSLNPEKLLHLVNQRIAPMCTWKAQAKIAVTAVQAIPGGLWNTLCHPMQRHSFSYGLTLDSSL